MCQGNCIACSSHCSIVNYPIRLVNSILPCFC